MVPKKDLRNNKYIVIERSTRKEVENAFVLVPRDDPSARVAPSAYAENTKNENTASFLRRLLDELRAVEKIKRKLNKC